MRSVIKHLAASIQNNGRIETGTQQSRNRRKSSRYMEIITVEPAKDISSCTTKPFVDRGSLTSIFFRSPETQLRIILPQNIDGPIGTSSVQNRILHIPIPLFDHAPHCFLDKSTLIVRRSYDRNSR